MKNVLIASGIGFTLLLAIGCAGPKSARAPRAAAEASYYVGQGNKALKTKDYDRAIDHLRRALALKPDSVEALNLLGMACFFKKDYRDAERHFNRAIALNASYSPPYNNLGNLYFLTGRLDRAEIFLKKSIEIAPQMASAHYSLGALLLQTGRIEEAAAALTKALDLDPTYLDTHKAFIASTEVRASPEAEFAWARIYAARGDVGKTADHLERAKQAGFRDWRRVETDKAFDAVRDSPEILKYLKSR